MDNFSGSLTIDGTKNLLAELITAGFQGDARLQTEGIIYNASATVIAYLHFTNSNADLPGVKQVETAVVAGTITTAGNSTWTVTASGMTDSPVAVTVALTLGMTASEIASAVVIAFEANDNIRSFFTIASNGTSLILTSKTVAANDATMNIAYADDTSVGLTDDASSNNTTAGALATTSGIPIESAAGVPSSTYTLPRGTDLSTIWIHTPSSIPIKVVVH